MLSLNQLDYKLKFIPNNSFIFDAHPLYVPQFLQIVLSEKHNYIFSLENMSCPSIMSYL